MNWTSWLSNGTLINWAAFYPYTNHLINPRRIAYRRFGRFPQFMVCGFISKQSLYSRSFKNWCFSSPWSPVLPHSQDHIGIFKQLLCYSGFRKLATCMCYGDTVEMSNNVHACSSADPRFALLRNISTNIFSLYLLLPVQTETLAIAFSQRGIAYQLREVYFETARIDLLRWNFWRSKTIHSTTPSIWLTICASSGKMIWTKVYLTIDNCLDNFYHLWH